MVGKIYGGEMLSTSLLSVFVQIFCQIILDSEIIVKSILGPDDDFQRN